VRRKYNRYETTGFRTRVGGPIFKHTLMAEKALGKALPKDAVVHHANGDWLNNVNSNLVICPDNAYHRLLHLRMKAKEVCGKASWRLCGYCKVYGNPQDPLFTSSIKTQKHYHKACASYYQRALRRSQGAQNG